MGGNMANWLSMAGDVAAVIVALVATGGLVAFSVRRGFSFARGTWLSFTNSRWFATVTSSVIAVCVAGLVLSLQVTLASLDALTAELQDTKDQLGGTWEPFGRDIKEVVNDVVKYEYALVRNGGFRTLTATSWTNGWRVMTSPYMTGDSDRFTLGGSMWIWGTEDARDDGRLYHLYYYFRGGEAVATDGNGIRSGGADSGEGIVYRRLR